MEDIQGKIHRLQAARTQIRWWQLGGVMTILVIVAGSLWHVRAQTLALVNDGPSHDVFMSQLKGGLARDLVPEAKKLTAKTINRLGPALQKEVNKIEQRLPEIANRAEKEMSLLRENLPLRAERALKPTFGKALNAQLVRWQKQYPNLTADDLARATERLSKEVENRTANVAAEVMLPYESCFEKIVEDLAEIRKLEAGGAEIDSWDLAVVSIGLAHDELSKLNLQTRQVILAGVNPKSNPKEMKRK
jgi:hypothetical protein